MKHTPQIRLQNARLALDIARERCPHWDYESEEAHECCYVVDDARRELRLAKKECKS